MKITGEVFLLNHVGIIKIKKRNAGPRGNATLKVELA